MMQGMVFSFVHAVILLTASFFVLSMVRKIDDQGLKVFGNVIAVLLWVSAAFVFAGGFSEGPRPGCPMMGKAPCPLMEERMAHHQRPEGPWSLKGMKNAGPDCMLGKKGSARMQPDPQEDPEDMGPGK